MDPTGTEPQKWGKPAGVARVQILAVLILAVAGVINYVDRGSLAISQVETTSLDQKTVPLRCAPR